MENVQENKILSFGLAHDIMLNLKNNEITDIFLSLFRNALWDADTVCVCVFSLLSAKAKFSLNLNVELLELPVPLNNVNELLELTEPE